MKKNIVYLFALLMLIACGGDDGGGGEAASGGSEYLNVGNVDVAGDRTSATLSIQASPNCEWTISCNDSWVSNIAPSSGRGNRDVAITLSGVNPSSSSSRVATLTVRNSSGRITRTVTLTQAANGEYLEIDGGDTQIFTSKAEDRVVTIRSNTHWTVSITGNTDKISVAPTAGDNDGRITISVKDNNTADKQEAVVTIKGTGGVTKQLKIEQAAANAPTITLPQISGVMANEATVSFTFDSSIPVSSCGICYATTHKAHDITQDAIVLSSTNTSPVEVKMTGLTSGTKYYVYGYVITSAGTHYSETVNFTTQSRKPGGDDVVTPY